MTSPLDSISVDLATGQIAYPSPEGFSLDLEKVYRVAARFAPFCGGSLEMAVKHAIHEQISAYKGARSLFARAR